MKVLPRFLSFHSQIQCHFRPRSRATDVVNIIFKQIYIIILFTPENVHPQSSGYQVCNRNCNEQRCTVSDCFCLVSNCRIPVLDRNFLLIDRTKTLEILFKKVVIDLISGSFFDHLKFEKLHFERVEIVEGSLKSIFLNVISMKKLVIKKTKKMTKFLFKNNNLIDLLKGKLLSIDVDEIPDDLDSLALETAASITNVSLHKIDRLDFLDQLDGLTSLELNDLPFEAVEKLQRYNNLRNKLMYITFSCITDAKFSSDTFKNFTNLKKLTFKGFESSNFSKDFWQYYQNITVWDSTAFENYEDDDVIVETAVPETKALFGKPTVASTRKRTKVRTVPTWLDNVPELDLSEFNEYDWSNNDVAYLPLTDEKIGDNKTEMTSEGNGRLLCSDWSKFFKWGVIGWLFWWLVV
ncbi:hypothetical protein HELRODRAFT_167147 [Helobdella robusta]|uniref:Uncharacterized protein n=1 Tax=Helobdella robusta TaxID=6412 RepID=T1EZ28_HELRO|nr:hypothetical protein HELRODRAFT_167147 [Helobdella robusta]ESO10639.1 hypothetical protein HELRODRAFT_167147 [Helobdella robusta]